MNKSLKEKDGLRHFVLFKPSYFFSFFLSAPSFFFPKRDGEIPPQRKRKKKRKI
jgi:hypothetical protein